MTITHTVGLDTETKLRLDDLHRVTGITRMKIMAVLLENVTPQDILHSQLDQANGRQA